MKTETLIDKRHTPIDPMLTLSSIFKRNNFTVLPPKKAKNKPEATITMEDNNRYTVVFSLKKLVKGQTFLGLYPTAANLPNADDSKIGDYALLGDGTIIQIGK